LQELFGVGFQLPNCLDQIILGITFGLARGYSSKKVTNRIGGLPLLLFWCG